MQDNSDLIIRDCCEAEAAEFGKPDTICITVDVLREIVQRHFPGTCLHQIQEPAAAEQAAWHAGLDEGRTQAGFTVSNAETPQAAPAAVAVPDERAAFEAKFRHLDLSQKPDAWGHARYSHDAISLAWEAWQARAMLAATPAAVATYIEVRECSDCGHIGINDADGSKAACSKCDWQGDSPVEDKCPDCNTVGTMTAACSKCGARASLLAETTLNAEPMAPTAAAPVVLPEPDAAIREVIALVNQAVRIGQEAARHDFHIRPNDSVNSLKRLDSAMLTIETKMRALLAGVSMPMVPPEWEKVRRGLTMVMLGFAGRPDCSESAAAAALDAVTEPGMPLAGLRHATALLATATGLPAQAFQQQVQPWMMACFGPEISADSRERNHRFLEEALELVQSCGCTASEAHQLVDYVYGRPWGEPAQEAGGVMVTLAALCLANGLDMHACGETELARIWTKVEAIRAKQAAKPKHSPLPMQAHQTQDALRLAFVLSEIRRDGMDALSAALHDLDGFPLGHQASVEAIDRAAIAAAKGE